MLYPQLLQELRIVHALTSTCGRVHITALTYEEQLYYSGELLPTLDVRAGQ